MSGTPYQPLSNEDSKVPFGSQAPSAPPPDTQSQYQPPGYPPPQQYPPQQYPPPPQYTAPQYPPPQQYPPLQQYPSQGAPPPQYGSSYPPETTDYEAQLSDPGIISFSEKSVRQGFIRKVYSILFVQLSISIGLVCLFVLEKSVNHFARTSSGLFWSAWVLAFALMIVLACCEGLRRKFPANIVLLGLFTLAESLLLGVVSAHYQVNEVLMAMGIVAVVTLAITLFAFQTKIDFTMMSGCLFVALIVLICFGIFAIFFHNKIVRLVYACLGALVFGLYLVMDTQLMMGGQKQYALDPEEYIFAALNLYVDIVTLFLYILQIIGLSK